MEVWEARAIVSALALMFSLVEWVSLHALLYYSNSHTRDDRFARECVLYTMSGAVWLSCAVSVWLARHWLVCILLILFVVGEIQARVRASDVLPTWCVILVFSVFAYALSSPFLSEEDHNVSPMSGNTEQHRSSVLHDPLHPVAYTKQPAASVVRIIVQASAPAA